MAIDPIMAGDEVYEFLTSSPSLEQIIAFKPSIQAQTRVRDLLEANRAGTLTDAERAELDEFAKVGHVMRMLKAHAQLKLTTQ